jgi:RNA polymerase sigma-70 factor (ECF subfamily)
MQDELKVARLVKASRKGDEDAFRQLLEEHRDAITSTLVACGVRSSETAHDLAQETALRAWTRLDSLRNPNTFSAWVRQIAANATRDYLRRLITRKEEPLDFVPEIADKSNPLDDLERKSELELMRSILEEEDGELVALLVDRAQGTSNRTLAERFGISDDAVKMRIMRARKRLSRRLQRLRED